MLTFNSHYDNIIYVRNKAFTLYHKQQNRKELFYEQKTKGHYDYSNFSYSGWRIGSTFLSAGHNKKSLYLTADYSIHEYEHTNHINAFCNSSALACILQTSAFFCLCGTSQNSGAFHKNFLPFAVADLTIPALLRRKGRKSPPRTCGREGR